MFYFTNDSVISISLSTPIFCLLKDHIYPKAFPMMFLSHVLLIEFIVRLSTVPSDCLIWSSMLLRHRRDILLRFRSCTCKLNPSVVWAIDQDQELFIDGIGISPQDICIVTCCHVTREFSGI